MSQQIAEIDLKCIKLNPHNPRKNFAGEGFDGLVASIKEKGVLEPVLARPVAGNGTYELVAGERRFRACIAVKLAAIPAIVRELSDKDMLEVMAIENLQREDLTEIEEARGFKTYLDLTGAEGLAGLAKAIGKKPRYIRGRVHVLELPEEILKGWEKGGLLYGHLEQLVRLGDPKRTVELFKRFNAQGYRHTVEDLADMINREAPKLGMAKFDRQACAECPHSTDRQRDLFGWDGRVKEATCLDAACFKHNQSDWFLKHWDKTATAKKYGTTGFRFHEGLDWGKVFQIYNAPKPKCAGCRDYISVIYLSGEPSYLTRGCVNQGCAKTTYKQANSDAAYRPQIQPWEIRKKFYQEAFPTACEKIDSADERFLRVACFGLFHSDWQMRKSFINRYNGGKEQDGRGTAALFWKIIQKKKDGDLRRMLADAVTDILSVAGAESLQALAAGVFGIDIKRDWRITADYLNKKDPKGLLAVGRELKLFDDPKAKAYLTGTLKAKKLETLEKKQLVALFLKSGVELKGKVPKEILKGLDEDGEDEE